MGSSLHSEAGAPDSVGSLGAAVAVVAAGTAAGTAVGIAVVAAGTAVAARSADLRQLPEYYC